MNKFSEKYNLAKKRKRYDIRLNKKANFPKYDKAEPIDERMLPVIDIYCGWFGCGRKLSLIEKLAGNKCQEHMVKKTFLFHDGKL